MNLKRNFQKFKNIYHLGRAVWANLVFGFPSRKIKVIGVTGTNGKTTTVEMIGKVLEGTGKKVAIYSTIKFKIADLEWVNKTKFTTQSAWSLQKFIKRTTENNCEYLVLETSSHALDQFRVWGVDYNTAVVTNVTREHLDYHIDMEDYRQAKLRLFEMVTRGKSNNNKVGIVNCMMKKPEEFLLEQMDKNYLYTLKPLVGKKNKKVIKIEAGEILLNNQGSQFKVGDIDFDLKLPGKFNVENSLAAISVGISEEVKMKIISKQLSKIKNVAGRMEMVENNEGIEIIIDYALTPDSMEKVGKMMQDSKKERNKFIWVFGSCGDRDRGKRPIMGEIASRYADILIITNEDPYSEDPVRILEEIEKGIEVKGNQKLYRIIDRKKALEKALDIAEKGDIVLVTGKGAEENMQIGNKKIPWNDKKVIKKLLNKKVK